MKRIRALGLGVVLALALLAFPAGASALGGIETESTGFGVNLVASESPEEIHTITTFGTNNCGSKLVSAKQYGKRASSATAFPTWNSCGNGPVKAGGCWLDFHPGSENTVDIGGPGCGTIVQEYAGCRMQIGPQSGIPASFTNSGSGSKRSIVIKVNASIKYTQEPIVPGFCSKTTGSGTYKGQWTLKGLDEAGNQVGIWATDLFEANGLFVSGEESEEEAQQPKFESDSYPNPVQGQQQGSFKLAPSEWSEELTVTCDTASFSGEMTGAATSLSLGAAYGSCKHSIGAPTVSMNSCRYVLNVLNAGPPYTGTMDVDCTKEGDAIETKVSGPFGICVMTVGEQSGLKGVSLTNVGVDRPGIEVNFSVKGITTGMEGGFFKCGTNYKTLTGSLAGTTTLLGFAE